MRAVCVDQPISWLRLERYRLGELVESEKRAIDEHLAHCPACQGCYAETEQQPELRPLPPLSDVVTLAAPQVPLSRPGRSLLQWLIRWRAAAIAVSAAAIALILWVQVVPRPFEQPRSRPSVSSVKGGTLALQLVRQRANAWSDRKLSFRTGDRFKLLVTSPPTLGPYWAVVVYQNQTAYFPLLLPTRPIHGNLVPLPKAIALDGKTPAEVCVAFGRPDELVRQRLAQGPKMLPENSVCVRVVPD